MSVIPFTATHTQKKMYKLLIIAVFGRSGHRTTFYLWSAIQLPHPRKIVQTNQWWVSQDGQNDKIFTNCPKTQKD